MPEKNAPIIAVVPAAGVGRRMQADRPKQYLMLHGKTLLEHTVYQLLNHPQIDKVIIALSEGDPYFSELALASDRRVLQVEGGQERADSVLSALRAIDNPEQTLALVHDAARPNVCLNDISALIEANQESEAGAILAAPVKDTMKRTSSDCAIIQTVDRDLLWHALTPQLFNAHQLMMALETGLSKGQLITDEASALELLGLKPRIVAGRSDNIKVTAPEDLELMNFYISKQLSQEITDV